MAKQHLRWTLAVAVVVCAVLVTLNLVSTSWAGGPDTRGLERALEVQNRNTVRLLSIKGVVGTATGRKADGRPVIQIYTEVPGIAGLPRSLEGVPVVVKVSGPLFALAEEPSTTDRWPRPVPIGVSTGNEGEISAGTIGARVKDSDGNVYALSNNHVYALENEAPLDSLVLQPGVYDGGTADDVIGTLHDFEPIKFSPSRRTRNMIDAAIALSSTAELGNATPSDGYGTPDSVWVDAALGEQVQKYGRTSQLTRGKITGINATVNVGYGSGTARFVDQIIVESADVFIQGGDSGSLLVTDPGKNPVGLLFAGNGDGTLAVANHIDLVLARFDVTIDGEEPPPVTVTDIAVTDVSAPVSVVGDEAKVDVTVGNVGNQDVTSDINVTLTDDTDDATIGTQKKISGGLAAGASTTLTFSWDTTDASLGEHTLIASQDFADDDASNDSGSTLVTVTEEGVGPTMHVASIEMSTGSRRAGRNTFVWAVAVVTIVDASGVVPVEVEGATVNGHWEDATGDSDYGTTDVSGEVSLESNSVKNPAAGTPFTFVVDGVAKAGCTYDSDANVETRASITL